MAETPFQEERWKYPTVKSQAFPALHKYACRPVYDRVDIVAPWDSRMSKQSMRGRFSEG